ncbi:MAG: sigma-54-dependent Fis family transcriptional regulator [Pirellulaceae bacterium]|nr:sigma-54-dependent Fis family transcriptional regulator [Pirellulaceae bacterium]
MTSFRLAGELLRATVESTSVGGLRSAVVELLMRHYPHARVAWLSQNGAQWALSGTTAALARVPIDLAAAACDRGQIVSQSEWCAAPLNIDRLDAYASSEPAEALLFSPRDLLSEDELVALTRIVQSCMLVARRQQHWTLRLEQLQTLLELAVSWHRTQDLTELLNNVAKAAARVLHADRASIFLWDRTAKELVGHPALGVEGQPLRIPDDQGIAGQVLKHGAPLRWDSSDDPNAINEQVGKQLGYLTRSLLAVQLVDYRGRAMGVFEVLNHRDGRFSADDELFLIELARHAATALHNTQRIEELVRTRDRLVQTASASTQLVGSCPQIESLRQTIARVAPTDLAVLILGENGTGKEVVSRSLHLQSRRNSQPFVAVNCAAIAETLLESELFGHEKGAFTDAVASRAGKFELAHGGTLLLDEIGEMSQGGQAKLLRVLEEKVVVRVGGSTPIRTDVRVIAATNQNLAELVRQKRFREDLYFRLNVVTLHLPALRERGDDILVLAEHFLEHFGAQIGRRSMTLSKMSQERMRAHAWPGNVRELRNMMERVVYLANNSVVEESDLAFVLAPTRAVEAKSLPSSMTLSDATSAFQSEYIQRHVDAAGGNIAHAAQRLGLHRSNLYRKMKQLGMETGDEL